jgi:hypothetical protein
MPLPTNLTSNEVKNASGTEVEFTRIESPGRAVIFAQVDESPALQHRLKVSHIESGSGLKERRRSAVRIDKSSISTVDSSTPVTTSAVFYIDAPVGALLTNAEMKAVIAEMTSFIATLGTNTLLYDGTGNGAAALLAGSL